MRIIDLLNKKADKTLKDGFKFVYNDCVYIYNKERDKILDAQRKRSMGDFWVIEDILLDKIECIEK